MTWGVQKSHSRPYDSDDNPYSKSQFKTLKYRPEMPERFSSIHDGRSLCRSLLGWYNQEHRHSGIAMLTPEVVHKGRVDEVLKARQGVLDAAYARHPERYVKGRPRVAALPTSVWINPPASLPEGLLQREDASGILGAAGKSVVNSADRAQNPPRSGGHNNPQQRE